VSLVGVVEREWQRGGRDAEERVVSDDGRAFEVKIASCHLLLAIQPAKTRNEPRTRVSRALVRFGSHGF
jgi:hypothetical protein